MANRIKYNVGTDANSLNIGNWSVGLQGTGMGPTATTGFENGVQIPTGGYAIYSQGVNVRIAADSEELLYILNKLGASLTEIDGLGTAMDWAIANNVLVLSDQFNNISTDGLVLNVDAKHIQSFTDNEPTTNLVPSSHVNGRFTTSNGWRTYNTNQYNGNTYFSIGTIGSVTNNIVTLSSVGRNIRSFDVLRPQTTGGGVTAGTDYFIKKITANTFSLHAYNGSQNGSQGYINDATGGHKVHDSYHYDQRVSISAAGFPTMWWGAPHLPNAALVKEIVENGGRLPGTNAMRLNVFREDNVRDGMAYGVYCPVTAGDTITMSVWLKLKDNTKPDATLGYSTYFGAGNGSHGTTFSGLTTEWQRFTTTWTASVTYNFYSYWWPSTNNALYSIDMCDFQVETGRDTPSSFTTSSRVQNTTINNLNGTNTGTLINNPTFNNGKWFDFSGVDDYINIPSASNFNMYCFEIMFKPHKTITPNLAPDNSDYSLCGITTTGTSANGINVYEWTGSMSNETLSIWTNGLATGITATIDTDFNHAVFNWNGSTYDIWLNGVKQNTVHRSHGAATLLTGVTNVTPGANLGYNYYHSGSISNVKAYDRSLTDAEIKQNYFDAPIVTDNLVFAIDASHLSSYEPGSATTYNLTGTETGTLTNGVGFDSANGGGWTFDGIDDNIQLDPSVIPAGDEISISFWNNGNSFASSTIIAASLNNSDQTLNIHLPWSNKNIYWDCGYPFNRIQKLATDAEILGWHNWVFTKNATTGNMSIYLDGALWHSGSGLTSSIPSMNVAHMGSYFTNNTLHHNGKIAQCLIYNQALSQEEVLQNYNATVARFK